MCKSRPRSSAQVVVTAARVRTRNGAAYITVSQQSLTPSMRSYCPTTTNCGKVKLLFSTFDTCRLINALYQSSQYSGFRSRRPSKLGAPNHSTTTAVRWRAQTLVCAVNRCEHNSAEACCRSKGGLDLAASEPPFSLLLKGLALVCPGRPTRATGQKGLLPGGSLQM